MDNKFASRKFIMALLALISTNWALYEKLISAEDFKAVMLGLLGLYMVGNVGALMATKEKA